MSKSLTEQSLRGKQEVDLAAREYTPSLLQARFPSYFRRFPFFQQFLMLSTSATPEMRCAARRHGIPPTAAIMAIV